MAESILASVARGAAQASGARFQLQTTILPPLTVDLSAAASVPPSTGPSPIAAAVGWLVRPTLVGQVAGQTRSYPLTQFGPAPVNVAPVLAGLTALQVGLSIYGAYKVVQWLRGKR